MATIDSNSTAAEIRAAYLDNCGYAEDGSVAKAKAFITACRALLLVLDKLRASEGNQVQHNPELIRQEMAEAQAWLANHSEAAADAGPRVTRPSFRTFR